MILGVYVELSVVAFENVPLGADQVALVAEPPMLPFNITDPPEHTRRGAPASTVAGVLSEMTVVLVTGTHGPGPSGSLVVSVRVTEPDPIADVYVVESEFGFEKVPLGADQVALVADPPIVPVMASDPP